MTRSDLKTAEPSQVVYVVDDDIDVREGLRSLLQSVSLGQGVIEGPADDPGDPGQVLAQRRACGTGHEKRVASIIRSLIV